MMLSLVGDGVVAVLLIATISYAAVLNRRLGVLRGDRAKLEALIQSLSVAAARAEVGIAGLKTAAEDVGRQLDKKTEEGRGLRDDLAYLLERGHGVADRLEDTIRARRDAGAPASSERKRDGRPEPALRAVPNADTRSAGEDGRAPSPIPSRAERELLKALGGR